MKKAFLTAGLVLLVAACAPGRRPPMSGGHGAPGGGAHEAGVNQPAAILAHARDEQAKQGCAAAIPSYRVVAGFGEGYEIAQYELGQCLLTAEGSGPAETALYREESLFWLRRAAWAGDPRAQGRLAFILSGAKDQIRDGIAPAPEAALGWALVYAANSERDLYGLKPVYPEIMTYLHATLTAADEKKAEAFAADFHEIKMAMFSPPAMQKEKGEGGGFPGGGGGRPPRR